MGASGWSYWTEYREDISEALEALREEAFQTGDYAPPWDAPDDYRPASLAELLDNCGESGTHSILDIDGVSTEPLEHGSTWKDAYGKLFPLTRGERRRQFDTTRPTRQQIEEKEFELMKLDIHRWSGRWVIAHDDDGNPLEYFIFGLSGD